MKRRFLVTLVSLSLVLSLTSITKAEQFPPFFEKYLTEKGDFDRFHEKGKALMEGFLKYIKESRDFEDVKNTIHDLEQQFKRQKEIAERNPKAFKDDKYWRERYIVAICHVDLMACKVGAENIQFIPKKYEYYIKNTVMRCRERLLSIPEREQLLDFMRKEVDMMYQELNSK